MCYYSERDKVVQIGFRQDASMLAGGGPGIPGKTVRTIPVGQGRVVKPESVVTPDTYGVTSDKQYKGGYAFTSVEMFSHVKTPGWHNVKVI